MSEKRCNTHQKIGGQAVIEGVMMRAPGAVATAVRHPSGEVVVRRNPYRSPSERFKILKLPILRGAVVLIESLVLGMKALVFSTEVAQEEEKSEKSAPRTFSWDILGAVVVALLLGLGLFFYLPLMATEWLGVENSILFNLVDGALRLVVFICYIWLISRWKEMRRVFEYHGAEHKVIFAYEAGEDVTVENARKFSTHHPRCGTSFLLVVMLVSIVVFTLLGKPESMGDRGLRLAMVPLIGGISYEIIRASDRTHDWVRRVVTAPGLWFQHWTTREPSDDQLEVALTAFNEARSGMETDEG